MRARWWLAVLVIAGCQSGTGPVVRTPDLPADYPPRIGGVAGVLGGQAMAWDTYDYSIGAFDSAVQIFDFNGETRFFLTGEPVGKPDADVNRLRIRAVMRGPGQTGALQGALIEFVAGKVLDGPRLSSAGSAAEVVLDSLVVDEGGYGGRVTGRFTATLCAGDGDPVVVNTSECQPISGTFDSRLQISGS